MLHIIDKCPICDLDLKKSLISGKNKYLCSSDEKNHVYYLDTNQDNKIISIYTIVNKYGIYWKLIEEKSLSIWIPLTEVRFVKFNLIYFEPNINNLKNEILSLIERCDKIKIFI
jgi:hypothetical protein